MGKRSLFSASDYASVNLEGEFQSEIQYLDNEQVRKAELSVQNDRRIRADLTVVRLTEPFGEVRKRFQETMWLALIAIPDAPEGWFITQTFDDPDKPDGLYLLANVENERSLKLYMPNCAGTRQITGMIVKENTHSKLGICEFTTQDAIFNAARDAVEFLDAKHPVAITPVFVLKKVDELTPETPKR
ncbi:MAG: hypothetical protein AAGK01_05140 [Pseudomonadota bacterium]